jgi:hypothetical protein
VKHGRVDLKESTAHGRPTALGILYEAFGGTLGTRLIWRALQAAAVEKLGSRACHTWPHGKPLCGLHAASPSNGGQPCRGRSCRDGSAALRGRPGSSGLGRAQRDARVDAVHECAVPSWPYIRVDEEPARFEKKSPAPPLRSSSPKKTLGCMPHICPVVPVRRPVSQRFSADCPPSSLLYTHPHPHCHATVACAFLDHFSHDCSSRSAQRSTRYR